MSHFKTRILSAAAAATVALLPLASAASERLSTSGRSNDIVIRVDVSEQQMTVMKNGRRLYSWDVSTGARGYSTPRGTYQPQWFSRNHKSRKYNNAPMPFAIFYDGGFAIHATFSTGMLGRPASHGCVRLSPENARTLYEMVYAHGKDDTFIVVQD